MIAIASYVTAAVLHAAVAFLLLVSIPGSRRAFLLTSAVGISSLWAIGVTAALVSGPNAEWVVVILDAVHLLAWIACVLSWSTGVTTKRWLFGTGLLATVITVVATLDTSVALVPRGAYAGIVVLVLIGFVAVEQVIRNATRDQLGYLKLLCGAAGGVFATDLVVGSQAVVLGDVLPGFLESKGFINAALLPLVVMANRRQGERQAELLVSRQVAFYTASLFGMGTYLLAMWAIARGIRLIGGEWSFYTEIVFLVAAVTFLLAVLFSGGWRARLRVLLLKHFYRNKYDYRDEWLRLTQSLGRAGDVVSAASNGLAALARIVGSTGGSLYVQQDPHRYTLVASLGNRSDAVDNYAQTHPLVTFMISTGWVVDTDEYAREPDRYGTAFGAPTDDLLPPNTIVVPLDSQGCLHGFVALQRPAGLAPLNFEDHDILKTAGRQIAAVLSQALAQEHLAQTRQFEAMNRLSAFLMHDLKNVVAQQELVIANAHRFRDRPGFFDDAIATVRTGVDRMKRVLEQLSSRALQTQSSRRVDVSKLLMEVRSQCADRHPIPEVLSVGRSAWVLMDRERLASALLHLVRNAQDATPPDGQIRLELEAAEDTLSIIVADTGCGMDAAFIRDRLFRPFDSTKGVQGMGIGAYQVRHLVRAAGGDVEVRSEPAVGTTFVIRLPADSAMHRPPPPQEA